MPRFYLSTGQTRCYDTAGREVDCRHTGQDAECSPGLPWPSPRFVTRGETVEDRLTGLMWTKQANFTGLPIDWPEAMATVKQMNGDAFAGHRDWRVPNRRELRSLISYQTRNPALPDPHPFRDVFLGWYWTSTSAAVNPAFAWYVHLEGGRMFYGGKAEHHLVWPVRDQGAAALPATGQAECYAVDGTRVTGDGTGQDGALRSGATWPNHRFQPEGDTVLDHLTGLVWTRCADIARRCVTWDESFEMIARLNADGCGDRSGWFLPTINELESLVDASNHTPALPRAHPFESVREAYWSSTSSGFEADWCMALYMNKGAVGVGQKKDENFSVWALCRENAC